MDLLKIITWDIEPNQYRNGCLDTSVFCNSHFRMCCVFNKTIMHAYWLCDVQVYRQDCETFGMVVKMLVAKDPNLEKHLQNPLKENLSEIRERCLEDLRHFISELDEVVRQPEPSVWGTSIASERKPSSMFWVYFILSRCVIFWNIIFFITKMNLSYFVYFPQASQS